MAAVCRLDSVFRRHDRSSVVHREPRRVEAPGTVASVPVTGELGRIARRFGLQAYDDAAAPSSVPSLAAAIQQAAHLWAAARPGQLQEGVSAVFGARAPASLIGARLWPVLTESGSGPALMLADGRRRVHVVVDVAHLPSGRPVRPEWVPAAGIAPSARMSGSHQLWRHWHGELSAHTPHAWTPACDDHVHLARPNVQGQLVAGLPQHDAWVMSRSWLPSRFVVPFTSDTRWIVLSASERPLAERDHLIRSRWDAVSFEEFAAVVAAHHGADATLHPSIATVLRMMLPTAPYGD